MFGLPIDKEKIESLTTDRDLKFGNNTESTFDSYCKYQYNFIIVIIFPSELAAIILLEFSSKALTFKIESKRTFSCTDEKRISSFLLHEKLRKINDTRRKN